MTTRKTLQGLKLFFGTAMLAFILWRANWEEVNRVLKGISPAWIAVLFLISFALIGVSCVKWELFLAARGAKVPFLQLFKLYLVGYFFNNFAPSNVGGDLARGMMLGRQIQSQSNSFGTVFLERFTGLVALILMALTAALFRPDLILNPTLALFLFLMAGGFAVLMLFLLSRRFQKFAYVILERLPLKKITAKLRAFLEVVFAFREHPALMCKAMALSLVFHLLTVVNTLAACRALGLEADLMILAVVVPIVLIIAIVPVSFNALGIMEGAFVFFLAYAELDSAEALSVALVLRVKTLILAAMGGVFFVLDPNRHPPGSMDA